MFCSRCGSWAPDNQATCSLCGLALQVDNWGVVPARPATVVVPIVSYAGFWRRLTSVLLDSVLLFFPAATMRVLVGLPALPDLLNATPTPPSAVAAEMLLDLLYVAVFVSSRRRATLGMQVMGLELTDLNGARIGFGRATLRWIAQILDLITLGIGYLIMLFTPRRQTLHDLVTGTVMVRAHHAESAPASRVPVPGLVP